MSRDAEAQRQAKRRYYEKNRDKIYQAQRRWCEKNRDKVREYQKDWYQKNRKVVISRAVKHGKSPKGRAYFRRYYQLRYAEAVKLKANKPCMDCGSVFHPAAMQWDHRPGEKKAHNVANLTASSREKRTAEIAKCDLVCANCHAVRTFNRRRESKE